MRLDPDVLIVLSLTLGMLTATPKTPRGETFLEAWPGWDGEALTLESSYTKGLLQEGEATGVLITVVPA